MASSENCTQSPPPLPLWRAELKRTVEDNPYIPWTPTDRQGAFLAWPSREVGYGGAAGGGKSAALLMAALQYVQTPGYNALLIRKTFADLMLPDALIPLSQEWLATTNAKWNGQHHQWVFPSGATLTFGYCETANDVFRYQGAALGFVGWDELTQFGEFPYRYLFSRLRKRKGLPVPLRFRSGFNPGGVGHDWVRARFVDGQTEGRRFIPAKLEDNPHLDREEYEASLAELDLVTRRQLRHGDWDIRPEGNVFKRAWLPVVEHAPAELKRVIRHWDLAATEPEKGKDPDYAVGAKLGLGHDGCTYILDVARLRDTPSSTETAVKNTSMVDGKNVAVRIEQEPGSSGKMLVAHFLRDVIPGFNVRGVPASGDKVTRAQPLSAAAERGLVKLVRANWNASFIDEMVAFPDVSHDDQVDAATGAFNGLHNVTELKAVRASQFQIARS